MSHHYNDLFSLLNKYHGALHRYARRMVLCDLAAREAVAKAFLRFYNADIKNVESEIRSALKEYTREACHGWLYTEMKKIIEEKKLTPKHLQQL